LTVLKRKKKLLIAKDYKQEKQLCDFLLNQMLVNISIKHILYITQGAAAGL
jgi:hypothetical protein